MAVTAYPLILVDAAGSDSNASGAGPSTALTGTAASTNTGTGATQVVTLDAGTDLTNVATDGSHIIYLADTAAGGRNFAAINAKAGSGGATPTVTVEQAFTASLSSKSWAIGGKRFSLNSTTTRKLFENNSSTGDMVGGWRVRLASGYTETLTSLLRWRIEGNATAGSILMEGTPGGTRPILTWSSDSNGIQLDNRWCDLKFLDLRNSSARTGTDYAIQSSNSDKSSGASPAAGNLLEDIKINHPTNKWVRGMFLRNGHRVISCEIANCTSHGVIFDISNANGPAVFDNCWIYSNGGDGIQIDTTNAGVRGPLSLYNSVFSGNTGRGVYVKSTNGSYGELTARNCDFYNNGSSGIYLDGTVNWWLYGSDIINCYFSTNAAWGILFNGMSLATVLPYKPFIRNNAFNANVSGEIGANGVAVLTTDGLDVARLSSAGPNNASYGSGGDFSKGASFAGQGVGWPAVPIAGSVTQSYVDEGCAQKQASNGPVGNITGARSIGTY